MSEFIGPDSTEIAHSESIDAEWYSDFEDINSQNDVAKSLDGDPEKREEARQKFISGEVENPTLVTNINLESIAKEEAGLLDLKERIIIGEVNDTLLQAYRWRINEKIAELRMLRASAEGDMRKFKRYAEFVYGKPSTEIFDYTISEVRSIMEKESDYKEETEPIARQLDSLLPQRKDIEGTISKPSQETVNAVKEIFAEEWKGLGITIEDDVETISEDDMSVMITQALAETGANDWDVIIDKERTAFNVSQEDKNVYVPASREYSPLKAKQLIAHEIMIHVGRRVTGENSHLSLLGLGLDRNQMGEEGVTDVAERGISGKKPTIGGLEPHLAIGLATGVDGKPRNFREVFEILNLVYRLKQLGKGKTPEEAQEYANEWAWKHCLRTFRGTDCSTPGVAYTKDIVYREGSIAVWDIVSKDTGEVRKFSIGKYNPSNKRHLWILSQLGITDEHLEEIES